MPPLIPATLVVLAGLIVAAIVILRRTAQTRHPRPRTDADAPPPPDVSVANLIARFGEDHVRSAWGVAIAPVGALLDDEEKFGGLPSHVGDDEWPRCRNCALPMTFIGQLRVGPDRPIKHPTDGWLSLFLCNTAATAGAQCETWSHDSGCSRCFVRPVAPRADRAPVARPEHEALAAAVARNRTETLGSLRQAFYVGIVRPDGARPYLARQWSAAPAVERPTVELPDDPTEAQYALAAALQGASSIHIGGGFPDWVQTPETVTCACGAETEFVLQFNAFDEMINLGDAGEAYVFACVKRCTPEAYYLFWQCC